MPFKKWYEGCREKFFVTSEMTLRSHLIEFKDHDMVKVKKGANAIDLFYIPFKPEELAFVLAELDNVE